MRVDYSVVIPAYNEEQLLPRTIHSLQAAMAALPAWSGELIVVDNNSTDATASIAASLGARVVFEPINQISRARNCGASAALGEYVVFVDADTMVPPELLRAALVALTEGGACGGGARVGSSEPKRPGARIALWVWNAISVVMGYAAGSFVYCRRDAWEAVGGFSDVLFAAEEIAFSKALRRWGRQRQLHFRILPLAVDTSMRKVAWFGPWQLLRLSLPLVFMPWRVRSREHCSLWYKRPGSSASEVADDGTSCPGRDDPQRNGMDGSGESRT